MVAYSFRPRFVEPILWGRKDQTIRDIGKRRHAEIGNAVQLYTGMRTRQCRLLLRSVCTATAPVTLNLTRRPEVLVAGEKLDALLLDAFGVRDGFSDFDDLARFWADAHPGISHFRGRLTRWRAPTAPVEIGSTVEACA